MNAQEIFTKVKNHLLTQNAQAYSQADNMCMYRYDGLQCAVGCLIPDECYTPAMEFKPVKEIARILLASPNEESIALGKTLLSHKGLLGVLQDMHDDKEDTTTWPFYLREIAQLYELEY